MTAPKFNIYLNDCFAELSNLPDSSISLLLTDPPYGTTNLEFDKIKIDWKKWWEEVDRVCKPSAVQICFAAQPFTTDLINSNRRSFRYADVWQKTNAVGFLSANVRPLRAHEDILIFCRKFGRVKGVLQSTYNPQFTQGAPYVHRSRARPARITAPPKTSGPIPILGDVTRRASSPIAGISLHITQPRNPSNCWNDWFCNTVMWAIWCSIRSQGQEVRELPAFSTTGASLAWRWTRNITPSRSTVFGKRLERV